MTAEIPDWAKNPPPQTGGVHGPLPDVSAWESLSQDEMKVLRNKLTESLLQVVVQAVQGFFIPGNIGAAFSQLQSWAGNLSAQAIAFIYQQTGLDFSSWPAFLASLSDGKGIDLPAIPKIVAALDGIPWESGDPGAILRAILSGIGSFGEDLESVFRLEYAGDDPALNGIQGVFGFLNAVIQLIIDALDGIDIQSGPGAILRAILAAGMRLVRNLRPEWLPQISLFSIGDSQPNLLAEPDFAAEETISGGGFYWDGTDGRTDPGCAAVDCDGEDHVVVSNLIAVSPGQVIDCGGYVSHAGATGTESIRIELATYLGDTQVSVATIGTITPTVDSTDWTASISGTFTVPAGVDMVAQQLHVTSDSTAGVVKYDDCWVKKQQLLKIPYVDQLSTALDEFTDRIRGIIDNVFNAFNNLGEWLDENNPLSSVLDAILGLLGIGTSAQSGVAIHEARIRALESAANTITLDFNGASASNPGPGFSVSSSGGGGGAMGLNGKGALVWKPSGAGNRTQLARYTTSALGTNNFIMEWVLASSPQSYLFDDAYTYLLARMDGTSNYIRIRSGYDSIRVQAVVGGVVSNIGPAWSGSPRSGDQYAWHVGDPGGGNNRHHQLLRNGVTLLDFTETTSVFGASNLHVGVGMETGNRLVLFQNIPAGLAVVTAMEVL